MNRIVISNRTCLIARLTTLITLLCAFSINLHAAASGGLPWEKPMQTIATSLTGPVAYAIGLI
jgi:type IV secretory pathway VirB2 component (pilin)